MSNRSNDLLILLGAGASAEAGILTSAAMVDRIEQLLDSDPEWQSYRQLYHHVKSAIFYSSGLRGTSHADVGYNIEVLVNTLYELERNEEHPIYPFIASWNFRFINLAGPGFSVIGQFRGRILDILKTWMCPEDRSAASYYMGLKRLQQSLNYPLRVFTLNYDRCVEDIGDSNFRVESGFGGDGPLYPWELHRFSDDGPTGSPFPELFLYKLHGSINWKRDPDTAKLYQVSQVQAVDARSMELIFGREFKLDAGDPYLFYIYEFRRLTAAARLILVIGYGFGDGHINKILTQALREDPDRQLCVLSRCQPEEIEAKGTWVAHRLECSNPARCKVIPGSAREFLSKPDLGEQVQRLIPSEPEPFMDDLSPGVNG